MGGSGQYTTIQSAINAAHDGDTILVAQGTYTENIKIDRPNNLVVQGGWSADFASRNNDNSLTVINGAARDSVVSVAVGRGTSVTLGIEGFTIRNGKTKDGAGIRAVAFDQGSKVVLTLANNTITGNLSTNNGGGVYIDTNAASIVAYLSDNTITENVTRYGGGGVRVSANQNGSAEITLVRNIVARNVVRGLSEAEGGLGVDWGGGIDGGGIAAFAGFAGKTTLLLKNNMITQNRADFGGGIFGYAMGADSVLVYTMTNNIIARNENGGGIFSCSGKTDPVGPTGGSVIWNLTNNTVALNTTKGGPAGFAAYSGSDFGDGGSITINMKNDIVWGNIDSRGDVDKTAQVGIGVAPGKAGIATLDAQYSDIGHIWNGEKGTFTVNHVFYQDPRFVDPANQDFRLQDGSPAIDSGDPNPAHNDARRPPGKGSERADLGAYGGGNNGNWTFGK